MQVTTGSDVSSFGVLMWVFYAGHHPYLWRDGEWTHNPAFPFFPKGRRFRDPIHMHYIHLARCCLHSDPHTRPTSPRSPRGCPSSWAIHVDNGGIPHPGPFMLTTGHREVGTPSQELGLPHYGTWGYPALMPFLQPALRPSKPTPPVFLLTGALHASCKHPTTARGGGGS